MKEQDTTNQTESAAGHPNFKVEPHEASHIKKVIGVVSGKGGVGKSLVTSLLAISAQRSGCKAAILDGDITGPSIPKAFGLHTKAQAVEAGIEPVMTDTGIAAMSLNLLLDHETDPVVWRGPILAGTVKQFWSDVMWGDIDYMFVDMPPGTGDVPLTVFQSLPVDGIVIVASPQELVSMVVEKSVNMAKLMGVPILGMVENMSYAICPKCGEKLHLFGESHVSEIAKKHEIDEVAQLPIDPQIAAACDAGEIEYIKEDRLQEFFQNISGKISK
ncbi:MAG: P-loop NTPase [Lachnospiraceae bacterium]